MKESWTRDEIVVLVRFYIDLIGSQSFRLKDAQKENFTTCQRLFHKHFALKSALEYYIRMFLSGISAVFGTIPFVSFEGFVLFLGRVFSRLVLVFALQQKRSEGFEFLRNEKNPFSMFESLLKIF